MIHHIRAKGNDAGNFSYEARIMGKTKRRLFVSLTNNRYASLQAVSSDKTRPKSRHDIAGNRYLQLIADHGTGYLAGVRMNIKDQASDAINRSLARL